MPRLTHVPRHLLWLEDLGRDVPYALRLLARSPGFTSAALITLALGIGGTTALFSVLHGVLLRPLTYSVHADRLVRLVVDVPDAGSRSDAPRRIPVTVSASDLQVLQSNTRMLSHVGAVSPTIMSLRGRDDGGRLQGARVSAGVFEMLGAKPLLGRLPGSIDETPGADAVVVLGYGVWQHHFAGDPGILGRTIVFDSVLGRRARHSYTIIGVMPSDFTFPGGRTQFWTPLAAAGEAAAVRAPLVGRLVDGVSPEPALAEIEPLVRSLREPPAAARYALVRERDVMTEPVRQALVVLSAATIVVLLIACANVANLLLARSATRQREMAVRASLGASWGRLLRQGLTESLVLAVLGGGAGVTLAVAGLALLKRLADIPVRFDLGSAPLLPRLHEISVDPSVLAFAAAIALVTAVLFGLAPAVRSSRTTRIDTSPRPASRARGLLVVAEISLALVLLTGGGLLIRSFVRLAGVNPGYEAADVLTFQVALPADAYPDARLRTFADTLVERAVSIPGIRAAGYANQLPLVQLRDSAGGLWRSPDPARPPAPGGADARFVSRGYLETMGIPVVAGRGFTAADGPGQPRVLLVNEALARREFPGENPLGHRVFVGRDPEPWQIVGVAADVRQFGFDRGAEPQFFADLRQWSGTGPLFPVGAYYAARTDADATAVLAGLRSLVRELEPQAALFNVATMDAIVASSLSRPRMHAALLGVFAGVGAALALVGIYGVMAYAVAQRTKEIGIRMTLGARPTIVLALVLRQGLALAAAGIALGLPAAAGAARLLEGMLFGLEPLDPFTFAAVPIAFASVAALAAYVPARRAARVDPLVTLRCE